jgi:hypothetical protein
MLLSCVRGTVTNSNGLWIEWLDLLALLLQLLWITMTYNSSQSVNAHDSLHSFLDYERLLFYCDCFGSDLQVGHFFSFRCPLAKTPHLKLSNNWIISEWRLSYEWPHLPLSDGLWMNWLTTPVRLTRSTKCPSFITSDEPKRDHYLQQFVYWAVSSVAMGMCLPSRCLAMHYSVPILCCVNVCSFHMLVSRCPEMEAYFC